MSSYQVRITAWDILDQVQWSVTCQDFDQLENGKYSQVLYVTGAMQGQGSDNPTRWLRAILEDIREQL